jgi:hypothetical protein
MARHFSTLSEPYYVLITWFPLAFAPCVRKPISLSRINANIFDCRQLFLIAGGPRARPSPGIPLRPRIFRGACFRKHSGAIARRENAKSYPVALFDRSNPGFGPLLPFGQAARCCRAPEL